VGDDLTIDELAREAGVPTSTVRLYQAKGLLPRPTIRGRVGYYGPGHLARMRLVARLQQRGFSLASIKHLADAWETGRSLDDLLGIEEQLVAWDRQAAELTADELAAVLDGVEITPEAMAHAMRLGVVEPIEDGRVRVPDLEYLRIGAELVRLGVQPDEVLVEYEHLQAAAQAVTGRFVALFDRHFLAPVEKREFEPDDVRGLSGTLDRLSRLAERVVLAAMRQSLAEAATDRLSHLAAEGGARARHRAARYPSPEAATKES
jgi:DNA-binding transcriptional MerR regulator